MLRIIHTADWHIGQTLRGHAREHEHRAVLAHLAQIAAARAADALIVAGDVFDHHNPSGDALRIFYEALLALRQARPDMTIVVTAGNHDAAGRLEAPRDLLAAMGVHVVGNVRRRDGRIEAARHLVPLSGAGAARRDIAAHVLAVSHPTAACLPGLSEGEAGEGRSPIVAATWALYAELAEATHATWCGLPLIVTGHLHVVGGIESEGAERRILVGGQHAVPTDVFPHEAAYVALGHLHKPQRIGRDTIRYAGSLLPLSASEIGTAHGVMQIDIADDGRVAMEHIPVPRPVPFLRIPDKGETRLEELGDRLAALALPADLPQDMRPFVQVRLAREGLTVGFRAEVDDLAGRFPVRLVDLRVGDPAQRPRATEVGPAVRLAELQPEDMFRAAFERAHGMAPSAQHLEVFHIAAAAAAAAGAGDC